MKTLSLPTQGMYPKQVYFADECYKVIFKKGLKCYGITDSGDRTITIKHGLSPRALLATFIHELLHVIEFEGPLKMSHKQVYRMELFILEILIDNFL